MWELNIAPIEDDHRSRTLRTDFPAPFKMNGLECISVRSFMEGIRFRTDDPRHFATMLLEGHAARKQGEIAASEFGQEYVFWGRLHIPYGSSAHHNLIKKAVRDMVLQNRHVKQVLRETSGFILTYDMGEMEPECLPLPVKDFLTTLNVLREEIFGVSFQKGLQSVP